MCPVAATQVYLQCTASCQSGSLFRHHLSGKPLSMSRLRCCLTSLIKKHNLDSVPKAHDFRKTASSSILRGHDLPHHIHDWLILSECLYVSLSPRDRVSNEHVCWARQSIRAHREIFSLRPDVLPYALGPLPYGELH